MFFILYKKFLLLYDHNNSRFSSNFGNIGKVEQKQAAKMKIERKFIDLLEIFILKYFNTFYIKCRQYLLS